MLRVTTLHASSAAATAAYYAEYLHGRSRRGAGGGRVARRSAFGLSGTVEVAALELLLSGRDPTRTPFGRELLDRYTCRRRLVRRCRGFDATFSAPKSLSVWWALTGDDRLLDAHDVAVVGRAGASGAVRVDDPHPLQRRPPASRRHGFDPRHVPPDDVPCR